MKCKKIGEVVICGSKFSVEMQEELFIDNKLDGSIEYNESRIRIDSRMKGDRRNEVFMHEVIHGIDSSLQLHMKEDDVQRMASGLHAMGVGQFLMEKVCGQAN